MQVKPKKRKSITIRSEDVDSLGTIMICAVRYAIGRETYMPGLVQEFIQRYPQAVTENVKVVILRDIDEADRVTEHVMPSGKILRIDHLGDPKIDRPGWLKFRDWLKDLEVKDDGRV